MDRPRFRPKLSGLLFDYFIVSMLRSNCVYLEIATELNSSLAGIMLYVD